MFTPVSSLLYRLFMVFVFVTVAVAATVSESYVVMRLSVV